MSAVYTPASGRVLVKSLMRSVSQNLSDDVKTSLLIEIEYVTGVAGEQWGEGGADLPTATFY